MANRTYLINSSVLTSDRKSLQLALDEHGAEYAVVAEGAYRIPVPWFVCFGLEDLQISKTTWSKMDGTEFEQELKIPCCTVSSAVVRIEASLPIFVRLAGNLEIATPYWQYSVDCLKKLPLPFLTMDPWEVAGDCADMKEGSAQFAMAFARDEQAFVQIADYSGYRFGFEPYSFRQFMSGEELNHDARKSNSVALMGGFFDSEFWYWHRQRTTVVHAPISAQQNLKPWWKRFWR